MARTVEFRVVNHRMGFKCSSCGKKRNMPIQVNVRRKNVRCHACGEITRCLLNRRTIHRKLQSGAATMITDDGKEIDVSIHDISTGGGIGVDISLRAARAQKVKVGQKVSFRCSWNTRLLGSGTFQVQNSNGQRVGVKKVMMGAF